MTFETASISNVGGRAANEDNAGYLEVGNSGCWVVADGLGGHGGGATASRLVVDAVLTSFQSNPIVSPEALRGFLVAAQTAVLREQAEPSLSQMRSTVVVLLANDQAAVCGHIGDSRLYHFQTGAVVFQTTDHSVPGALAAGGSIPYDQIRYHEDRNRVLRSLGNSAEVNPAIAERSISNGDMFLLCSDGFWEYVTEPEMEADATKAAAPADWLRFMASRLLKRAKPEHDNYTAVAVFCGPVALMAPPLEAGGGRSQSPGISHSEKSIWVALWCLGLILAFFLGVALFAQPLAKAVVKGHWPIFAAHKKTTRTGTTPAESPESRGR